MEEIPKDPVYSRNVLEMITVANDFCITMRKFDTLKKKELADYLSKVGPLLYLKGALLPDVEVSHPEANERFLMEEEYEALLNGLFKKFGKDNDLWIAEVDNRNGDLAKHSLAEYLTDVYQEMYDFLELYQKNSKAAKENAVFELKKSFAERWGLEMIHSLTNIHTIVYRIAGSDPVFDIPELF